MVPLIFISLASVLCVELSVAENLLEKLFHKTKGPYFISLEAVNWTDAKIGCQNVGLELASVISEEEQINLKTFLKEYNLIPEDKWSGYWLSGIRHTDGKYYWDSTETEIDSSFGGWCRGEPSHAYERENCIELKWGHNDSGWNDYFCDETRRYICQVTRKFKPKLVKKKQQIIYPKEYTHSAYEIRRVRDETEPDIYGSEPVVITDRIEDYDYTTQADYESVKRLG